MVLLLLLGCAGAERPSGPMGVDFGEKASFCPAQDCVRVVSGEDVRVYSYGGELLREQARSELRNTSTNKRSHDGRWTLVDGRVMAPALGDLNLPVLEGWTTVIGVGERGVVFNLMGSETAWHWDGTALSPLGVEATAAAWDEGGALWLAGREEVWLLGSDDRTRVDLPRPPDAAPICGYRPRGTPIRALQFDDGDLLIWTDEQLFRWRGEILTQTETTVRRPRSPRLSGTLRSLVLDGVELLQWAERPAEVALSSNKRLLYLRSMRGGTGGLWDLREGVRVADEAPVFPAPEEPEGAEVSIDNEGAVRAGPHRLWLYPSGGWLLLRDDGAWVGERLPLLVEEEVAKLPPVAW